MSVAALLCCAAVSLPDPLAVYQQALAAREQRDAIEFLERSYQLEQYAPTSPPMRFLHAEALTLRGYKTEALADLEWLAKNGYAYAFWERSTFESLTAERNVEALRASTTRNGQPSGKIARAIAADADLNAEGIDTFDGGWIVGSMKDGSLYRIDTAGATTVMWRETEPSRRMLGIRNDPARKVVWACSTGANDSEPHSQLLRIPLQPGPAQRFQLPDTRSLCNDVALLPGGAVAVSDSQRGGILVLSESGEWRTLVAPEVFGYPNGLTWFAPLKRLVVADLRGLWAIDLGGTVTEVPSAPGTFVGGIDGLYAAGNALLAIQNGLRPHRVLRIQIAAAKPQVAGIEVLASNLPELAEMTTAAVGDGRLTVLSSDKKRTVLVQLVSSGSADD
jgi:hypothetical protein